MRTRVLLLLAALLMAIVSTVAIGSNMGFKISIPLTAPSGSHSGSNWVALPFYNQYTDAASIFADVAGCTQVSRYVPSTDGFEDYLGFDLPPISVNFSISSSDGFSYLIKVASDTNWVVVGSHNPAQKLNLYAPSPIHSGTNWIGVPYHSTATDAASLFAEIATCTQVSRYVPETDGFEDYLGFDLPPISTNFSLARGGAYLVKVSSDQVGGSGWLPSHY